MSALKSPLRVPTDNQDWKSLITARLQHRNKVQMFCFQDLINAHNRIFDHANALKTENIQLSIQLEKTRQVGFDALKAGDGSSDSRMVSNEQLLTLEKKLLAQQEELTEIHKKRGENAQMIVNLNNQLAEKEKLLNMKEDALTESLSAIASLKAEIKMYQSNHKQLEELYQLLKDEHQALQLTSTKLEEKLRKTQTENMELVDRLKRYKFKDAEKMNEENENFLRKRNAKMQRELEDAAKDMKGFSAEVFGRECGGLPNFSSNAIPVKTFLNFEAHEGEVNAVKWHPVSRLIATGGADRKVKLWDVSKGCAEYRGTLVGSNFGVMSVDFDSAGEVVIAASNDRASRIWTVSDQRLRHTLTSHCAKVLAAKFLSEPTKVVTGSHDRTVKIFDLRSRACIETKFAGSSCNDVVTVDNSVGVIFSGHFDKKIRMWDSRTYKEQQGIEVQGKVTSLDISSRDFRYLLACVRDDSLRLIDLRTNQILQTFTAEGFKVGCDWTRAVFNADATYVSCGAADGSVYIWNVATGEVEGLLKNEHNSFVTAVSWHRLTNQLVSVDKTKKAVVWSDV